MRHTHPIYVRPLSESKEERAVLRDSLRSSDAFVLRRAQIVLASAAGEHATQIAPHVGLTGQSVRDVIHAFNERGLDVLARRSQASPVVVSSFDTVGVQALRDLLHQSPRLYGKDASLWTLEVAADVAYERGLTATRVSGATIHNTLARMGVRWRRAKGRITGPDPEYAREKASRDRLIGWPRPILTGSSASRTRSGGAAWPSRPGAPGPTTTGRRAWSSRRSRATTPTLKPWRATAC